jgi:hypothetical protein
MPFDIITYIYYGMRIAIFISTLQEYNDRFYFQKIDRVLDDLRNFLGDEKVIAERCHTLIALGEFEMEISILDCTPYCAGKISS